mmetsp:Transcript_66859/g.164844  ORF Transcript_66859/g.164844 Transcript_66859/m.164844 type:complete len:222 (-) Transcript_66859:2326-2991(-)
MLMTHPHMPAAAEDLDFIVVTLKASLLSRFFSIHSHAATGALSLSKLTSCPRNWSTLPIIFLAAPHDTSLGILPPPISTITPAVTSSTPAGGLASDLSSPRSFLLSVSSAASAFSTAGMAAARSRSQSACILDAASATMAVLAASSLAADAATSTLAFSPPTTSATSSALRAAASTSTDLTCTCSMRIATSLDVVSSFSSPLPRRVMLPSRSVRFLLSMFL